MEKQKKEIEYYFEGEKGLEEVLFELVIIKMTKETVLLDT